LGYQECILWKRIVGDSEGMIQEDTYAVYAARNSFVWLPAIFVVKYQQIQVPHLVHRSPCEFGKETSAWALDLIYTSCTDNVDATFIQKPQRWNIKLIRDFMIFIGPMPGLYFLFLAGATLTYLPLVEVVKRILMRRWLGVE
jgi:hypothetical protein